MIQMSHRSKTIETVRRLAVVLLCLCLAFGFPLPACAEAPTAAAVRVAVIGCPNFLSVSEGGTAFGYAYQYLDEIAKYTGWTYEYVSLSFDEALTALAEGTIDILPGVELSEERAQRYLFSEYDMGPTTTVLCVLADQTSYAFGDYASYDGMRIGSLRGSYCGSRIEARIAQEKVSVSVSEYATDADLQAALQSGEIDAMAFTNLDRTGEYRMIASLCPYDMYFALPQGKQELKAALDNAMEHILSGDAYFASKLYNTYYGQMTQNTSFTPSEQAYINEHGPVTVALSTGIYPMEYYDQSTGKFAGFVPEYFDLLAEYTGLAFRFVPRQDAATLKQQAANGEVDMVGTIVAQGVAPSLGASETDAPYSNTLSLITKSTHTTSTEQDTVGVLAGYPYFIAAAKTLGFTTIVEYKTAAEAVEAVNKGSIQSAIVSTTTTATLLGHSYYKDLIAAEIDGSEIFYCFGVFDAAADADLLLGILNKGIRSIPEEQVKTVRTQVLLNVKTPHTWRDTLYDNAALFVLLGCMLLLLVFVLYARRKEKLQNQQARRLMGYFCHYNEFVQEVNLAQGKITDYRMAGDRLETKVITFTPDAAFTDVIHPDDLAEIKSELSRDALKALAASGGEATYEVRIRDKEGQYRWKIVTIDGIKTDRKHPGNFMLFVRDIHALKEKEAQSKQALMDALQQAENASRAKGDFMSRMSHEIRTPLNAIIGYLSIAKDEHNDVEKVDHCIEKSQVASKHLLGIINDVLDISSIESGRMKIASADFDLTQMVNSLTTIFYAQATAKQVTFAVHLDQIEAECVRGDELRVRQIQLNLLSNAVKFTPAGGSVTLSLKQICGVGEHQERIRMEFRVTDTGIGMSQEYMSRMFQPFEQEDASTARNYGGSGLGLSITNNLVHMMGGQLQVDSEQGKGAAFTVLLPFEAAEQPMRPAADMPVFDDLRVLVVDDDSDTCIYTQKVLAHLGVKSDTVTSGKKALRRVLTRRDSGHPYDLCIIDWCMKDMDGLETAKEVRKLCGKDIPIIIATAYDYTGIVDEAKAVGVNRIVSKPLFQSTLYNMLVDTYGHGSAAQLDKASVGDFTGTKLLLAEDNEMNMEIALNILRKAGLEITPVVNGQEALDTFEKSAPGTFDAILMDIQMPVMDGYTAARAIRSSAHAEAKSIPIIAMTANAFTEDVTAALAAGMNDHVSKPISYDRLFSTLAKLIRKRKA